MPVNSLPPARHHCEEPVPALSIPSPWVLGCCFGASKPSLLQSWALLALLQELLAPIADQMWGWPMLSWLPTRAWDLLPSADPGPTGSAAGTLPAITLSTSSVIQILKQDRSQYRLLWTLLVTNLRAECDSLSTRYLPIWLSPHPGWNIPAWIEEYYGNSIVSIAKVDVNDIHHSPLILSSSHFITEDTQLVMHDLPPDSPCWLSTVTPSPSCAQKSASRGLAPASGRLTVLWFPGVSFRSFLKIGEDRFPFLQLLGTFQTFKQLCKDIGHYSSMQPIGSYMLSIYNLRLGFWAGINMTVKQIVLYLRQCILLSWTDLTVQLYNKSYFAPGLFHAEVTVIIWRSLTSSPPHVDSVTFHNSV